ncbi:hypothetical protein ACLKA6_011186 [Drosophila palustris]
MRVRDPNRSYPIWYDSAIPPNGHLDNAKSWAKGNAKGMRTCPYSRDGGDIEKVGTKSAEEPPSSPPNYKFDAAAGSRQSAVDDAFNGP